MTPNYLRYITLCGLALVLTACAQTSQSALSPVAGFAPSTSDSEAPSPSLAPSDRPGDVPRSGYQIDGEGFYGDLHYLEEGDRVRAVYAHAVEGDVTRHADLRPEAAWLHDGVRRFEGQDENGEAMLIELEAGVCRVNGRVYARFARVEAADGAYEGCAAEIGPHVSWSEALPRYLPLIRACLEESRASSMTFVRGAGRAQVLHVDDHGERPVVRMRFGESGRWDCVLENGAARWRVVSEGAPLQAGEADPFFIVDAVPDAGEACAVYERVISEDGEILGALGYDVCQSGPVALLGPGAR